MSDGSIVVLSEAFNSGSGRFLLSLANALSAFRSVVLVSPPHLEEQLIAPAVERRHLRSLQNVRPFVLKALAMQYQTLCRIWHALALRKRAQAYLVVFPGKIIFAFQLLGVMRLFGCRIVLNVHDVHPHKRDLPFLPAGLERWLFKIYYKLPHVIVVLTNAAAREITEDYGVTRSRVTVVPHGDFSLTSQPLPCPADACRFLVFGALRANKRILESIMAVQSLRQSHPQISLVIAGQAHREEAAYWRSCKEQVAKSPGGIEIKEGYIPDSSLPDLFADCSAILLPYSNFTSQSGVGVMGVLSGRPIVAVATGGIADLFAAGEVGVEIAQPADAKAIAGALDAFMTVAIRQSYENVLATARSLALTLSWPNVARGFSNALGERQ